MKSVFKGVIIVCLLFAGGYVIPISEYTTTGADVCPVEGAASVHLSYLKGDRIEKIMAEDAAASAPDVAAGCRPALRYVLYAL